MAMNDPRSGQAIRTNLYASHQEKQSQAADAADAADASGSTAIRIMGGRMWVRVGRACPRRAGPEPKLWSAPAERSGDGALAGARAGLEEKRRRRFALPAHSITKAATPRI